MIFLDSGLKWGETDASSECPMKLPCLILLMFNSQVFRGRLPPDHHKHPEMPMETASTRIWEFQVKNKVSKNMSEKNYHPFGFRRIKAAFTRKVGGANQKPEKLNSTILWNYCTIFQWLMQAFIILLLELTPKKKNRSSKESFYYAICCVCVRLMSVLCVVSTCSIFIL